MDDSSREYMSDWLLSPVNNVRTTNTPAKPKAPVAKSTLKTELQVVRLSDDSQKMTMETLRAVHGDDFRLDDITKYKDRGGSVKRAYWQDRGTLVVQGVSNFSAKPKSTENDANSGGSCSGPEDRLRRYALLKLATYGFAETHCIEAYDHCDCDTDEALLLLYRKYMNVPTDAERSSTILDHEMSTAELIDMRNDEKEALKSIYDKAFEEVECNKVWNFKFKIEHLLKHSPSEVRKARAAAELAAAAKKIVPNAKAKKERAICKNFERDGTCRFGPKCRFAHVRPVMEDRTENRRTRDNLDENENEQWFYVEVRFPSDLRYPYEAPFIYLKTTCHDIPPDVRLRLSRRLYHEANESCRDGIPCVYSICELLKTDEGIGETLDTDSFPAAQRSLFYVADIDVLASNGHANNEPLPTHYERGQTARNESGYQRDATKLERDNRKLLQQFMERQKDENYRKMISKRRDLPAFSRMEEILSLIDKSQVVVISGETGCGKSTQVPQFILDNWFFRASQLDKSKEMPHVEVICTQPRRLSAIGVAERVASERTDRIGQIVGYQIRLENKISSNTRLTFCTTGILLRRLSTDPLLKSVSHIIVDEVHERSEESDFLLFILKRILQKRRDLKVILMSATLNAKLFSDYFGDVPVLDIPGRTFPVEQLFLEDILESCGFVMECDSKYCRKIKKKEEEQLLRELELAENINSCATPSKTVKDEMLDLANTYARYADYSQLTCKNIYLMEPMTVNPELIESVLKYIVEGEHEWPRKGSILIFLPGLQEIQAVHEALMDSQLFSPRAGKFLLVPLHSTLSSEEQAAVFRPAPEGKRKIVLSTNIAETSVTIDDCVFVIDSGLMKEKRFDANRNMESLDLVWVSRANAQQRKGRAGRVMPGICIHLYTSNRYYYNILSQPVPEIHRVPLEQLVLRIKTLKTLANQSPLDVLRETLEPPAHENIMSALARLRDVGALDDCDQLTPLGHHLAALPVDVRIGKLMLYGAIFQCLDSVLTIAACLSTKTPFVSPFNKRAAAEKCKREFAICNSDHLTTLMAYKKWLEVSKRNFYASRNYASEHYLSLKTLETISEVKYQFLELLVSIGFVPINVPRKRKNASDTILELTGHELNSNGENNRLLISLLCAALYPNVVKILTPERLYIQTAGGAMPKMATARDLRFQTREDRYVNIHPSSVNSHIASFQSPFLIYQEKVRTSCIFIRECSMLPLISLVLFAGSDFKVELHGGDFLFLLEDGWVILKAHNHETAEMIQCLRIELLKLLEEKIRDPCLNLLNHQNGRKIIQNIVFLIGNNN